MNDEDPAIIEHEKKIYDRGGASLVLYHLVLPLQTVTLYSVSGLIPTAASRCVFACSRALRQAETFTGKIPAVIMEVRGWSEKLATDSEAAVRAGSQPMLWHPWSLISLTGGVV